MHYYWFKDNLITEVTGLHPVQNIHVWIFSVLLPCVHLQPTLKAVIPNIHKAVFLKRCSAEMWGFQKIKERVPQEISVAVWQWQFKCYNFHKLHLKPFLFSFDNDSFAEMFPNCCSVTTDTTTTFQKRFFLLWNCALVMSTTISWCSNYIAAAFLGRGDSNSIRYCSVLLGTAQYCSVLFSIAQYCLILLRIAWYCSVLLSTIRISCISVTSQKWKEFVTKKRKITHAIKKSKNWVYKFLSFTINMTVK